MEFLILGPIEVRDGSGAVALGGIKPRAVLAVLLLNANEPVSAERLALALWGEDAPGGAVKTVQVHVSRLRKALGDPDVDRDDARRLQPARARRRARRRALRAPRRGRAPRAGRRRRPRTRATLLREALALWRGPALAELAARAVRRRRDRAAGGAAPRRRSSCASRPTSPPGATPRSSASCSGSSARTRCASGLAAQLMLALYRCGRQTEALEAYAATRRVLVEEMGVEPGPQLRELHEAILRQDVGAAGAADRLRAARRARPLGRAAAGRPRRRAGVAARALGARARRPRRARRAGRPARDRQDAAGGGARARRSTVRASRSCTPAGTGPADAILVALRRVRDADAPALLVVDDADGAGAGVRDELARARAELARAPVLVVAVRARTRRRSRA